MLSSQQIQSEICAFLTSLLGKSCEPQDDLRALGVDSIAFLELIIFIEKKLHVPLPLDLITSQPVSTIHALTTQLVSIQSELQSSKE